MVVGVLSSIVSALLIGGVSLLWRHRGNLSLLRTTLYPRGLVRVSFAALLRIKDDDRYVLVESSTRPGFYGPPGGVFKYHEAAIPTLDALGFHEQRFEQRRDHMKRDIRGFVPARAAAAFLRWFVTGEDRETATECLRRELVEELDDPGRPGWGSDVGSLTFRHVRTVMEGPRPVPNEHYRQMRRFEVYDMVVTDETSARIRRRLIDMSRDPATGATLCTNATEIATGWCGDTPLTPHTAYLVGRSPSRADLPARP